jgi:hypothetical protein
MTTATTEIETITAQIADLRVLWNDMAANGRHAEAVGVENEIAALERSSARYEIQQNAERTKNARLRAVDAANSTLRDIAKHKSARSELESVVAGIEAAAKAVDAALGRLGPSWTQCVATWPTWEQFNDPAQQEAYNETLGGDRFPVFDPLRLRLRLPLVLDILRMRGNRGLNDILSVADARF